MRLNMSIAWFLLNLPGLSFADKLTVIYDSGETLPIEKFYQPLRGERPTETETAPDTIKFDVNSYFPIRSAHLTLGVVERHEHNASHLRNLPTPIFLIGTDSDSQQWLEQQRAKLLELQAVGYVVDAETLADYQAVCQRNPNLTLIPASADDFAALLGLTHYPAVITQTEVYQ
jgi:integrating conjugative element protein (TIGR03765 family)